jgi:hypothetical protein
MPFARANASELPMTARNSVFLTLALLALPVTAAWADEAAPSESSWPFEDARFSGTLGLSYSNGGYGTPRNTNVELALPALAMETGNFRFTASLPYLRISGRGLVVFDSVGNPIVINRRSNLPPDVRTGWGDLDLSASYTIPAGLLDDFQVKISGLVKAPTGSARRRLSTGEWDFGASIDVSRKFDIWEPFVTVGYLVPGQTPAFQLYNTTSVSAGTALELSDDLVAVASYDFDSASTPLVVASHEVFGSLTWVRSDRFTLTGYTTGGLSDGAPNFGGGLLISYHFN